MLSVPRRFKGLATVDKSKTLQSIRLLSLVTAYLTTLSVQVKQ